jgi:uncharacterized protein
LSRLVRLGFKHSILEKSVFAIIPIIFMKLFSNSSAGWKLWCQRLFSTVTIAVLLAHWVAAPALATGVYEMSDAPASDTWVIDKAEVISRSNEGKINLALADLAAKTGNEVRLVTIHRLDYEETAETFTNALFDRWFPTPEAQANQTLLVIDNLTNDTAIRTGSAVKSVMSDEIARSVAQETILIPLKEDNKYNQAFLGASDRLVAVLSGNPDPGPPEVKDTVQVEGTFATPEDTKSSNATVWVIGFLIAATIIPMATYYLYVR